MAPAPFIVVVAANVLSPLTRGDSVLRAAAHDFFQLRWTKDILDEMERNLAKTGTTTAEKAAKLRAQMERFFPEAMVAGYETLIPVMQNDAKDRHGDLQRPPVTFEALLDRLNYIVPELITGVREQLGAGL